MKWWWLPLLPVLVCAPCVAVSLFLVGAAAAGFGLVQVMHRQGSCDPSLSNGGRG